jgi:hypothetical protein
VAAKLSTMRTVARRTSHIDMADVTGGRGLRLSGGAQDSVSGRGVVASASVDATLDRTHTLLALSTTPGDPRVDALVGLTVGRGFRGAVDEILSSSEDAASPLYLLLDDLPVATLVSGYALLYRNDPSMRVVDPSRLQADLCAGWASEGTMLEAFRSSGRIPVPMGPPAADDVGLPPGAMRRERVVDVDDAGAVSAMFRDTHVDLDGHATVLHEYALTAALDRSSLVLSGVVATPVVLPWPECPAAAASAARLDGHALDELRELVRREFKGTSTCTHLNDLLRSLADLGPLGALLPSTNSA